MSGALIQQVAVQAVRRRSAGIVILRTAVTDMCVLFLDRSDVLDRRNRFIGLNERKIKKLDKKN